jgi:predicted ArsR family transcriptional regulator
MTGKEKILDFLSRNSSATDEEIAELCDMNPSSARTRRLELELEGLIEVCGKTHTTSGRETYLWRLKK